jgi:translocation and assembly module TamB
LEVAEWSLGWFDGIKGSGIVYDNRGDDLLVRAVELKSDGGLIDLILSRGKLGTVDILDPAVVFYITDKPQPRGADETAAPAPTPAAEPPEKAKVTVPAVYGRFVIKGGSLRTVRGAGNEKVVAKDLDLMLDASGPENPLTYRFSVESGDNSGRASGEGTLVLSADDPLNVHKIRSDSKLHIENWELEDGFAILASRKTIPAAGGRLNADVTLTGSTAESLHLLSRLSIEKLKLRGGPLKSDTPTVTGIAVDLDAAGDTNAVSLKNLTFRSSLANGSANGKFDSKGEQRLSGKADVNLAELFTQLPATLQLREGTRILKGRMALAANLEKFRDLTTFKGDAQIDRLQGTSNGKQLSWDKPVTIDARGDIRPDGIRLENMSLHSAFLNADGRGDMRNMQVDLSADIAAALKELKKFIEIKQWDGSGKLNLDLNVNEKSKNLAKAAMKLDVRDFILNRNGGRILTKQDIKADLSADMKMAENLGQGMLLQPALNIHSSLADGKFTAASLEANPTNKFPNATDMALDGNVDLQQVSALLRNLGMLSSNTQLSGQSIVIAAASLKDGQLALNDAKADTRNFVYRQDNKTIKEERLRIATRGRIDFNKNSLHLAPVDIDGQAGKIHIPELTVADWTNAQKEMKTSGNADLDLDKLTRGYGDFIQVPEKTQISGRGRFDFDVDFSNPKTQYLNLQGDLTPFKMESETLPTISEKKVTLKADVTRSPDGQHLTIKSFDLNSNALTLTADGSLDQVGKNKVFKAQGTMAPDLGLVSDYLKKSGKQSIEFEGKKATPFTIEMTSKGDRWEDPLKHLNFSGALHVDSINAFGLKLSPNDIPVRVDGAAAGAQLESPANGGRLSLQPAINMQKEPYVLSFTRDLNILKEVQITKGLTEGLLSLIHPVFKDAIKPEGMMDLHMKHFNWPLVQEAGKNASFAGSLRFNGVKLNSTPFLSGLLALMRVKEREFDLGDQTIDFAAENGRLKCSPLTIDIGGSPLVMYGSVGFDKTLDYIAQIPLTENMVGRDAFRFLQGVSVKVPIHGTVSKPKIDETALQDATAGLVQQAMQKNLQQGVQNLLQNLFKQKN